jgi:60 kDa SS-A/Ro ribonucleoprotein
VGRWYVDRGADDLAHQAVKYQQRDGWSHADLLRLAHPKAPSVQHDAVFRWMLCGSSASQGADPLGEREVKRKVRGEDRVAKYAAVGALPKFIEAFEQVKRSTNVIQVVKLIDEFDLPREAIPTQWLNEATVWGALLARMPMTAMIRNLGKMTSLGLLAPFSDAKCLIIRKLRDETSLKRARIHPLAVLVAQKIYDQGHGDKGTLKWSAVSAVVDALDEAFYATFQNVEPCGKPVLLALDVSGSMAGSMIAGSCISAREASATMALVTAATEPEHEIIAFSAAAGGHGGKWGGGEPGITRVNLSPRMRLAEVIKRVEAIPMGGTDCALPMLWAARNKLNVAGFITYTDSETWAGNIHPAQALRQYRNEFGGNAKAVVVGMTSNGFTLADPNDRGMMDVVGYDTSAPAVIADFVRE